MFTTASAGSYYNYSILKLSTNVYISSELYYLNLKKVGCLKIKLMSNTTNYLNKASLTIFIFIYLLQLQHEWVENLKNLSYLFTSDITFCMCVL